MILLDTNVLSALMQREPDAAVIRWLDAQPRVSVWTTAISVFEIQSGMRSMPAGKRRTALMSAFDRLLQQVLEQRIAAFDAAATEHAAMLFAARQKKGQPIELRDTMIAGIAHATRATLATRNVRRFADLQTTVVNPWQAGSTR